MPVKCIERNVEKKNMNKSNSHKLIHHNFIFAQHINVLNQNIEMKIEVVKTNTDFVLNSHAHEK